MERTITGPYEPKPTGPELPNQRKFESIAAQRGQRSVLLIFSPAPSKHAYKTFLRELEANQQDLATRNLEVMVILDTGRAPRDWNYLPGQQSVKARHKFEIAGGDFALILIGVNGHIKHRWKEAIDYDALTAALT
ncbi:MAG: DUF4174 domain-containing protein [Acidobacteriaceae bacterium]